MTGGSTDNFDLDTRTAIMGTDNCYYRYFGILARAAVHVHGVNERKGRKVNLKYLN